MDVRGSPSVLAGLFAGIATSCTGSAKEWCEYEVDQIHDAYLYPEQLEEYFDAHGDGDGDGDDGDDSELEDVCEEICEDSFSIAEWNNLMWVGCSEEGMVEDKVHIECRYGCAWVP